METTRHPLGSSDAYAANRTTINFSIRPEYSSQLEKETISTAAEPSSSSGSVKSEASSKEPAHRDGSTETPVNSSEAYPHGIKLFLITLALCLGVFLFSLDNTIIGVAIPKITDQFNSLEDVGWYGSAYLVTTCALQPTFGKLYTIFTIEWVYLCAVLVFELGSLLCGAAPSSTALIIGRAIAGIGCAGIYSGSLVIIAHTVPLRKRPIYTGLVGGMYGIASVGGPLLGGVFTDTLSWRWCFYINLPVGSITLVIIALFLNTSAGSKKQLNLRAKLRRIDLLGTAILVPAVICLLLAFQWAGTRYPWNDAKVVSLIVVGSLLSFAFASSQIRQKSSASIPPRILGQRSVACAALFNLCCGATFLLPTFYLPIWFQAIKGTTAVRSGIDTLPLILGAVVMSIVGGGLVTAIGYYAPLMIASSISMAVGSGLLTTLAIGTTTANWIGFQIILGIGIGLGLQLPLIAVQTVLPLEDIPTGTAIVGFFQSLGGAILLSVGQTVFSNTLVSGIRSAASSVDPRVVTSTGATDLAKAVPRDVLGSLLPVLDRAIARTFYVAVAVALLSIVGSVLIEWKSVKGNESKDMP